MPTNPRIHLLATLTVLLTTMCCSRASAGAQHPCAAISDDSARLACYDRAFGHPEAAAAAIATPASVASGPSAAASAAPAAAVGVPVAVETAQTAEQQFGLHPQKAGAAEPKPVAEARPAQIQSTATEVRRKPYGELVVSLENGQVWEQVEADSRVHIKPGDAVTIHTAALGSFFMKSGYTTLRVRRIR